MNRAHPSPTLGQRPGAATPGEERQPVKPIASPSRSCPSRRKGTRRTRCSRPECLDGGPCTRLAELGLGDDEQPLPRSMRPRCGARTRAGGLCLMRVERGKRRCRLARRRPRAGRGSPRRSGGGGRRGERKLNDAMIESCIAGRQSPALWHKHERARRIDVQHHCPVPLDGGWDRRRTRCRRQPTMIVEQRRGPAGSTSAWCRAGLRPST
jgi:hypothetical protein